MVVNAFSDAERLVKPPHTTSRTGFQLFPGPFTIHPTKSIIVSTAGHIDHGKMAQVRALTGIDADRLPEEKRRGITIDIGFADSIVATCASVLSMCPDTNVL